MPIKVKLTKDENGNIKDIVLNPKTITIEKEVWESTIRVSMERAAEIEKLKEQINKYILASINCGTANAIKAVKEFGMPERIEELVKKNTKLKTECHILAQTLLKVSPEHKAWLEKNYKEYL